MNDESERVVCGQDFEGALRTQKKIDEVCRLNEMTTKTTKLFEFLDRFFKFGTNAHAQPTCAQEVSVRTKGKRAHTFRI